MHWDGNNLVVEIRERCMPFPRLLRGTITLEIERLYDHAVLLNAKGLHHWQAVAPRARIHVAMQNPELTWNGAAYHDMNWGNEPIENGFRHWTWARINNDNSTDVVYDVQRRDGSDEAFVMHFGKTAEKTLCTWPQHRLPKGTWNMPRVVTAPAEPELVETLEDAPFYTRNHLRVHKGHDAKEMMHESLSLDRWVHPITQMMLPFRMPRKS
jgi:carotenoid 1,2-hydratase